MTFLYVGIGGAIGAMLRYGVTLSAARWLGASFPYGTLAVNVIGSLVMGLCAGYFAARIGTNEAKLFIMTGLLGGFTTFSAFSLDAVTLWQRGQFSVSALYITASVVLAIGALLIGLKLARILS
ncbi:MAG: fluoride efflux transporter CrcB [Hyphomicrobiales bacterium]|nr:MAG: fluoride efflux transporter CrcB [Hyphomicrobiales bacterium]